MSIKQESRQVQDTLSIPEIFRIYLKKRGISGGGCLERFLFPQLADLPKPDIMKNLLEASRLVATYMHSGQQIIVWGDYDVDGTTGTALLVNFFKECNIDVLWHIPDRLDDGYGLNIEWFTRHSGSLLCKDFLLITVDCGISNAKEIRKIQELGGKVIVTDHHSLPESNLPNCIILNPLQPGCGFHDEKLAGVGVAFYLAAGIRNELATLDKFSLVSKAVNLKQYLAFVALGTIADVVDLTGTNRILVRAGIEALLTTPFPGLQALLESCDISGGVILAEDIGYLLGPKINAAGRLGKSRLVVQLLTSKEQGKARKLAGQLTALNEERKAISADNLEAILETLSGSRIQIEKCVITCGAKHQGVAGIIASKLVEVYGFPSLVFAKKPSPDDSVMYVGSARSVEGLNIMEILRSCSRWIEQFGGHEMAAGLTVAEENFEGFCQDFIVMARKLWENRRIVAKNLYDIECSVEDLLSEKFLTVLQLLEPFGPGNPQPVFQDNNAKIVDSRSVGRGHAHLQLTIRGKYSNIKGIGFSLGDRISDIQKHSQRIIRYVPTINRFRGNISWQVRVIDI